MDTCKTWFASLSAELIQRCIDCCGKDCSACRDGLMSPLLHFHNELNLHEKIERYFNKVVQEMDIDKLYDQFIVQFGWFNLEREQYVAIGQSFARFSTPDAIFYGKYVTAENDFTLYGHVESNKVLLNEKLAEKSIKVKRKKKIDISQNDVLGCGASS